jgi:hypothetical protein
MLDPGSARCLEQYQAGTKKRRVVSRTKKHDVSGVTPPKRGGVIRGFVIIVFY